MSTIKRLNNSYTIQTLDGNDSITLDSAFTTVTGDLTVVGNAVLLGNINADRIFNGTSNVEITTPGGNVQISVGGINDVVDIGTTGIAVSGLIFASGNITGSNVNTAGLITATGNIDGGNLRTLGNVLIQRDASAATPEIRFDDSDTTVSDGQVLGQIVWETSDAVPGERTTTVLRSIASGTGGNANLQILTSTNGAAASVKFTVLSTGNVGVANDTPTTTFSVGGTIYGSSTLEAVGNITGGNVITGGLITATGNVTGGNVITGGLITATGNITGANIDAANHTGATVSVTGNVTGGNLLSQGIISATGNLTTTDIFGTTVSVSGNITGGNVATAGQITASVGVTTANVDVSSKISGPGIGVENIIYQASDAIISSATPVTMGVLQFDAVANSAYKFVAWVPVTPDGSMTVSPAVNFSSGSCIYTTELQTTATSAWSVATKNASDDVATTYAMTGTNLRTIRISGWYYNTSNTTVAMRIQNSTGNITVQTGAYLAYTRTA